MKDVAAGWCAGAGGRRVERCLRARLRRRGAARRGMCIVFLFFFCGMLANVIK